MNTIFFSHTKPDDDCFYDGRDEDDECDNDSEFMKRLILNLVYKRIFCNINRTLYL